MQDLHPNHIDIWLAFPEDIRDAALLEQYRLLLCDPERVQEKRFHFPRDQHRYLITRALTRLTLSRYAPVAPQDWTFASTHYGKPYITNDNPVAQRLSFNISHTQGLVVLAVASGRPLGIDTEHIHKRTAPIEVASNYFSASETAALLGRPKEEQSDVFFHYWTLKEAYIKARGKGLSIPLDQFSFDLARGDAHPHVTLSSLEDPDYARWRFWQHQVSADHVVAICTACDEGETVSLHARQVIPLRQDWEHPCTLLRASA